MFAKFIKKNRVRQKGFTILVAVVTAGILLIIAMSIGGIALKEQILSTSGKESQVAFYAADTGMECALYWDQKIGAFAADQNGNLPTSPYVDCSATPTNATLTATSNPVPALSNPPTLYTYSYSFTVNNIPVGTGSAKTCAKIIIEKTMYDNSNDPITQVARDPNKVYTKVKSYGFNTCDPSLTRLERGIEANY